MVRTTHEIKTAFGAGSLKNEITIPAGTRVKPITPYPMQTHPQFWVDDLSFLDRNSITHHDATRYGITLTGTDVYGAPTFLQYDEQQEQWLEWKRQAALLSLAEIRRHASVSRENRHSCRECFCCAAAEVLAEVTTK
jgi:hypothetical protein